MRIRFTGHPLDAEVRNTSLKNLNDCLEKAGIKDDKDCYVEMDCDNGFISHVEVITENKQLKKTVSDLIKNTRGIIL